MNIRHIVELAEEERNELLELIRSGKPGARKVRRANILLMADRRAHTDEQIIQALSTSSTSQTLG